MAFGSKSRRGRYQPQAKKPKIVNCKICGRAYVETGNKMCRDCYEKEQEMQLEVLSYVREHSDCTAREVMDETGASPGLIRRMMQEGHFMVDDISEVSYPCSKCGTPIIVGHLCNKCQEETLKKINKITQEMAKRQEVERQNKLARLQEERGMYIVEALGVKK